MRIGNVTLEAPLMLAPMAGVTDAAFRLLCREEGAAFTCTELISSKALCFHDRKTFSLLRRFPEEQPSAVQIFGSDPACMAEAAAIALEETGAQVIDLNMGCPMGKIVNNGDGSALMRSPDLAGRIVEAVNAAVPVPVTAKIRRGWDMGSCNCVEVAQVLESAGAAAIAVHGRTRAQMYAGRADWDIIKEVKQAVTIPVTANGDIFEPEDAEHILRYTGCDLAMIGRGSFGNPWLFQRANALLEGKEIPELPPLRERIDLAVGQIEELSQHAGERIACLEARHQLPWYLHGVAHSGCYKQELVHVETLAELRRIAAGIKRDLR